MGTFGSTSLNADVWKFAIKIASKTQLALMAMPKTSMYYKVILRCFNIRRAYTTCFKIKPIFYYIFVPKKSILLNITVKGRKIFLFGYLVHLVEYSTTKITGFYNASVDANIETSALEASVQH